jgi:hypothetical protein
VTAWIRIGPYLKDFKEGSRGSRKASADLKPTQGFEEAGLLIYVAQDQQPLILAIPTKLVVYSNPTKQVGVFVCSRFSTLMEFGE